MKKNVLEFIKSQLDNIAAAQSLEQVQAMVLVLNEYIDNEMPEEMIELSIRKHSPRDLIQAIKIVRQATNCGLKEAKDHVEQGTVFYSSTDLKAVLNVKKQIEPYAIVDIKGGKALGVLYG